jgi:sulfur transfer protein SufE
MKPVLQLCAGLFLIAAGTGNAFVMNNGRSKTHVSLEPFTFLPTNIKKKNSIKSTLKSVSKNEEEVSPVNQSFHEMADSLVLNKDAKQTNLELVSRGQSFDSYRRRFDYFPNSLSTNDGQSKSVWVRDNTKNSNLIAYLVASRGLSVEDATEEAEKVSRQSFKRVKKSGTQAVRASYTDFDFIISTKSSQEDEIVEYAWEGDKYVTTIFLEVNGERKLIEKIERQLDFGGDTLNTGDGVIMTVKSTYYGETEILTCEETFCRAFDGKQVKVSEVERVPACIANVNVQTILLPKGDGEYDIFLDGEADALLSRGLLAVLSETLSSPSINAEVVLDIDSFRVADKLRLRSILSTGRNDGLGSILTVVQRQITELLGGKTIHDKKEDFDGKEKKSEVRKPTVAMLLSGGVDSAVSLSLLLEKGYDVTAFYLKIWLEDELAHLGECPWEDDFNTCVEVCKHAGGVKLEAISLQEQYKNRVISYAIDEAKRGRTPNPDIMCNRYVYLFIHLTCLLVA